MCLLNLLSVWKKSNAISIQIRNYFNKFRNSHIKNQFKFTGQYSRCLNFCSLKKLRKKNTTWKNVKNWTCENLFLNQKNYSKTLLLVLFVSTNDKLLRLTFKFHKEWFWKMIEFFSIQSPNLVNLKWISWQFLLKYD